MYVWNTPIKEMPRITFATHWGIGGTVGKNRILILLYFGMILIPESRSKWYFYGTEVLKHGFKI